MKKTGVNVMNKFVKSSQCICPVFCEPLKITEHPSSDIVFGDDLLDDLFLGFVLGISMDEVFQHRIVVHSFTAKFFGNESLEIFIVTGFIRINFCYANDQVDKAKK